MIARVPELHEVRVTIPGKPIAQGRPRITTVGGFARAYDPARSRTWKGVASMRMEAAMAGRPPLEGPLYVRVVAVFPCPAGEHRKRNPVGRRWHGKFGADGDNVAKAAMDAATSILWHDDSQVAHLEVLKLVGAQVEAPYLEMLARPLDAEPPAADRATPTTGGLS